MAYDPEVVKFSKKAGVVFGMLVSVIIVMTFFWPWMPWTLRTYATALDVRITNTEMVVNDIRDIMRIQAVLMSETPGSDDYEAARLQLKRMKVIEYNPKRSR